MRPGREFLKGCTQTVVLSLLSERSRYGYELSEEIHRRTGGILDLPQGTLYPLLYTLERKGLIEGRWQEAKEGRARKYYALTAKGRRTGASDVAQWTDLARGMARILGGRLAPVR
mgnify:CR=1 FL=1